MEIKIIGEKTSSLLVNSLTNESLAIIVTSKNDTEVRYSIINKDPKKRTLLLQIYFPEELHISSLAVPDTVEVKVKSRIQFRSDETIVTLFENDKQRYILPP